MSPLKIAAAFLVVTALPAVFAAQSKRTTKSRSKTTMTATATPQPTPEATPKPLTPPKRNERPGDNGNGQTKLPNAPQPANYFYRFERPGFTYPSIAIEHDEAGRGQIAFVKEGNDVGIVDPIELSPATLVKIKDTLTALNFLDSTETYQTPRDYSTMGNVTVTYKRDGRSRTVKYNWSDNKNAKALADEYRRISNDYIWRFEITLARENQPLSAPSLMDQMADYLNRNEISDPPHMLPLLRELANDERIPLIARDRAAKLTASIEKAVVNRSNAP
jgi:hypothetical protein